MSSNLKVLPRTIAQLVAAGAFSALCVPALAQQSADPQGDAVRTDPTIQKVEVTGSYIRRADAETPSPVQVISAKEMQNSGYTSVSEVLQHITANGAGTLSQNFQGGFAAGGSGISLRGLNDNATLVLIDGHRMASYPLADDGSRSFVDISNIPFDAVERIEILKDGASAVYGSDAVAGVVNVILKKNYSGTSFSAEGGRTTEGGGKTQHFTLSHGMGDLDKDGYNAYINAEYRHQDPIFYTQRVGDGIWSQLDMSAFGGANKAAGVITPQSTAPTTLSPYLLNPNVTRVAGANNSAAFGFLPGTACASYAQLSAGGCAYTDPQKEIQPRTENINILASVTKKLGGDWLANVKASIFESRDTLPQGTSMYPSSYGQQLEMLSGVAPHYIVGSAIPAIRIPATYPGNPFGVAAVVRGAIPNAPENDIKTDSKAYRLVADFTGTWGAWDMDLSLGYTRDNLERKATAALNVPALNAALNRTVSPFNITNPSASDLAAIYTQTRSFDTSELDFAEVHASRSLFKLPGGDVQISTGGEIFHDKLSAPSMPNADGYTSGAYAFGSETVSSAYAEFSAPLLKTLEFDGAVRYDHYSKAGNSTTPKIAFKWTPNEMLAVRGTLAKGFRAPGPAENGNAASAGGVGNAADPVLCPGGYRTDGRYPKGTVVSSCNESLIGLTTTNPDLKPEKSVSGTFGLILEPVRGWSTALDFYQITIKDQIVGGPLSGTPVRTSAVPVTDCADGNGGVYTCTPTTGGIAYYPATPINANSTRTRGAEIDSRYRWNLGSYGRLRTELQYTHAFSYVMNIAGESYELAGGHGPAGIGADTANPKDRAEVDVEWERGPLDVTTTFHWTSGYDLTDPTSGQTTCAEGGTMNGVFPNGNTPDQFCRVHSFLETDLAVNYKLDQKWTLHASVTNLFNQQPPVDVSTYGSGYPYNLSLHSAGAVGRYFNIGAIYKF
nr:TonB-dependent Receptor Plug Domain [uncultured organism]